MVDIREHEMPGTTLDADHRDYDLHNTEPKQLHALARNGRIKNGHR